jgi:hypothetical protein
LYIDQLRFTFLGDCNAIPPSKKKVFASQSTGKDLPPRNGMLGSEWSPPRQEIKPAANGAAPAVSGEDTGDIVALVHITCD